MSKIKILNGFDFDIETFLIAKFIAKRYGFQQFRYKHPDIDYPKTLLQALKCGQIYYVIDLQLFRGHPNETIKKELSNIGAKYDTIKRGYFIQFTLLPKEIQNYLLTTRTQKEELIYQLNKQKQQLLGKEDAKTEKFLTKLSTIIAYKVISNLFTTATTNNDLKRLRELLATKSKNELLVKLKDDLTYQIFLDVNKQYDIAIKLLGKPQKRVADIMFLPLSLQETARIAINQTILRYQVDTCKQVYKSDKFIWLHRQPVQPNDRPLHIHWHNKVFDLNNPPYDAEIGRPVIPGQLRYCHCSMHILT